MTSSEATNQPDEHEGPGDPPRIVVGVDGSDHSEHALRWACQEARRRGSSVQVVMAWHVPIPVTSAGALAPAAFYDSSQIEGFAQDSLTASVDRIGREVGADLRISPRLVEGGAAKSLLAESRGAEMLVVGSHGRGAFGSTVLGSLSRQVASHALCPTVVVPLHAPLPDAGGDVVCGVDGSEGSYVALRWAIGEAARRGATLAVVHAYHTPFPVPPAGLALAPTDNKVFVEQSERLLHQMSDGLLARAEHRPPDVELLPIADVAPSALKERARGSGLLVVGSRGRGGFVGLLLGSVAQRCLEHPPVAVAVIPERDASLPAG